MRIVHDIAASVTEETAAELRALGIELSSTGFITFDVDEGDAKWPRVAEWTARHGAVDTVRTEFTSDEIGRATWLELMPEWHHGYPQPEEDFGYLQVTYDLRDYCNACGMGLRQRSAFRMKREPKMGTKKHHAVELGIR
jgi:hypothetical protein